jgi:hypothetical protein
LLPITVVHNLQDTEAMGMKRITLFLTMENWIAIWLRIETHRHAGMHAAA